MRLKNEALRYALGMGIAALLGFALVGQAAPKLRQIAGTPDEGSGPAPAASPDSGSPTAADEDPYQNAPAWQPGSTELQATAYETRGAAAPILDAATSRISFQALLTQNNGNPLPGPTVDLAFRIYNSAGEVVEGPIVMSGEPLSSGVVDVQVPVSFASFDGSERRLGVTVNGGAELSPRIPLTAVPHAFRVSFVDNAELTDDVVLGDAASFAEGTLKVENASGGPGGIALVGSWSSTEPVPRLYLADADGSVVADMLDSGTGLLTPDRGGILRVAGPGGVDADRGIEVYGEHGSFGGGWIRGYSADQMDVIHVETFASGGIFRTFDEVGQTAFVAGTSGAQGAFSYLYNGAGALTVMLDGDDGLGKGLIFSDNLDIHGGAVRLKTGADLIAYDPNEMPVAELKDHAGGAWLRTFDENGLVTMTAGSSDTVGGFINLYNAAGNVTLRLDADEAGESLIVTDNLTVTGGSDIAEPFHVAGQNIEPGYVVCIDPTSAGHLVVSRKAYDRTVAGIVSGAGGIKAGLTMRQEGAAAAEGNHPVALTGRVYAWCDASYGPIAPGDLLTTSGTAGHAMKVTDHDRAVGAIIGKAMTPLGEGRGLVLVLVSLQ